MSASLPVSFSDVLDAEPRVHKYLDKTALYQWPGLSKQLSCHYFLKHENHQPTGAFKVRGGINLVATLNDNDRQRGIIGCTTGNHGQSLAFACRAFDIRCVLIAPIGNNPDKMQAMTNWGAELIEHGKDFDEARGEVERRSAEEGLRYIHSANEPLLIAGVATCTLEIIEDEPDIEVLIVPIGGGSGAAGAGLVLEKLSPGTRLIGVQAEEAPAACLSWQEGSLVEAPMSTKAEGLATRCAFELTQQMLRKHLDEFVLLGEAEMTAAARLYLEKTGNLAELSGAAALGAALKLADSLAGKKTAVILSGSNISPGELRGILEPS